MCVVSYTCTCFSRSVHHVRLIIEGHLPQESCSPKRGSLATMGRGLSWAPEHIEMLKKYREQKKGPQWVANAHPEWSLSSIKKIMARIGRGEDTYKYKGRSSVLQNPEVHEFVQVEVARDKSFRQIQQGLNEHLCTSVSRSGVAKHVQRKVAFKRVRKVHKFGIGPRTQVQRKEFAQGVLAMLKHGPRRLRTRQKTTEGVSLKYWLFTGEKMIQTGCVSEENSSLSKRLRLNEGSKDLGAPHVPNHSGVMVSVAVSIVTKIMPPCFINPRVKVDSNEYVRLLEDHYLVQLGQWPEMVANGLWQEDNAPSHNSRITNAWKDLHWRMQEIKWPPNSADLQPLDFSIWHQIERRLAPSYPNIPSFKQAIVDAIAYLNTVGWPAVEQALKLFPKRLEECLTAEGGHVDA